MASTDSPSADSPSELRPDISSLTFRVEPFAEHHLPIVARFSERYWSRPRTESFYRWRYLESLPFSAMFVAKTDSECLGLICALRKHYLVERTQAPCLEIFDWHSLPGLKGSGVGIRVMRAPMRSGTRLLGVGGTNDVLKALPAMGWQTVGQAVTFDIEAGRDGRSANTSYRVISIADEYDLLDHFGVTRTSQSLVYDAAGEPVDCLKLAAPDKEGRFNLCFNVAKPLAAPRQSGHEPRWCCHFRSFAPSSLAAATSNVKNGKAFSFVANARCRHSAKSAPLLSS